MMAKLMAAARMAGLSMAIGILGGTALTGSPPVASDLAAQEPPPTPTDDSSEGWNTARALELVERAREQRQSLVVDSTMHSYRADARGHVYFFMDRAGGDTRSLVKADQIALDVMWQAPGRTKQHIAGLRDRKLLPTDIRYHLDHLTIVQDDFGDSMRMGDGDEVSEVLHPVGPSSEDTYDFLVADSLTLLLPEREGRVQVFELRVRPKSLDRPGFVGSVFLDQATAAIVRMNFSFTPASYVDPYIDYIRVSLDNSLWMGRHWLPYRQEMEIRRELPFMDFLAGSVIRGRFEVRDYEFNVAFPPTTFTGQEVTSASITEREAFPFTEPLLAGLDEEGLAPTPSLSDVEKQVREVVEDRFLTGLAPLRFHLPSISEAFRYNRAEGVFLGAGASLRPSDRIQLRGAAGYALGREKPSGSLAVTTARGRRVHPRVDLYWNASRDIGGHPGAPPLENTIAALSGRKDYLDPYFARGAAITFQGRSATEGPRLTLRWEQHHQARDVVSDDLTTTEYRPVRGIDRGTLGSAELTVPVSLTPTTSAEGTLTGGRIASRAFATLGLEARQTFDLHPLRGDGEVSAATGWATGDAPAQALYLLGGRTTLPGHGYRDFVGDRYWLVRAEGTIPVYEPWIGVRLIGAAGATYLGPRDLPERWTSEDSNGVRASVGAGLSLAWDIMRIDLAYGVRGGGWEAVFSVAPGLRPWI
ncbi:MAG: hypothetical protein U5R14_01625 [Gemmatimonadota bacterium]|nr:hypothetical protein [Gemmatimonadota bacterium]